MERGSKRNVYRRGRRRGAPIKQLNGREARRRPALLLLAAPPGFLELGEAVTQIRWCFDGLVSLVSPNQIYQAQNKHGSLSLSLQNKKNHRLIPCRLISAALNPPLLHCLVLLVMTSQLELSEARRPIH
jgi:hypothetical protein